MADWNPSPRCSATHKLVIYMTTFSRRISPFFPEFRHFLVSARGKLGLVAPLPLHGTNSSDFCMNNLIELLQLLCGHAGTDRSGTVKKGVPICLSGEPLPGIPKLLVFLLTHHHDS